MDCMVAVGSQNPVKILATKKVFKLVCNPTVKAVHADTGVSRQPIGFREILLGAYNRACYALRNTRADYGVGIEAGLVDIDGIVFIELQSAMIVDSSGLVGVGLSAGFQLPGEWIKPLLERVELEELAVKATNRSSIGEKLGLIGYLTQGHTTRLDLTLQALTMALIPFINKPLYKDKLTVDHIVKKLNSSCQL